MGEISDEMYKKILKLYKNDSSIFQSSKQDVNLNELDQILIYLEKNLNTEIDINFLISQIAKYIVNFGVVKSFEVEEEREFTSDDFSEIHQNAQKSFILLKLLLNKFEVLNKLGQCNFLSYVLLLCAFHNQSYMWSNDNAMKLSHDMIQELLSLTQKKNLLHLLCDDKYHPTIFKHILLIMRPILLKNTWIKNPSSPEIFYWFLTTVKHPHLIDYVYDILPPSLMFVDHYHIPNKAIGIKCLDHIFDNVPPSFLKSDGKLDVIYHALSPLIHRKELPIVENLYPCLLKFPKNKSEIYDKLNWDKFDEIYNKLLWNIEMEGSIELKIIFSNFINLYIESEKIYPIKHLKRTIRVIDALLPVYNGPEERCRINLLKILKNVIRYCWPRMSFHCMEIMKIILFLVYDLETDRGTPNIEVKEELLNHCKECLILLRCACPDAFEKLAEDFKEVDDKIPAIRFLKSIKTEPKC